MQWLAAATLFALMAVVTVDVTGRYLFNRPLPAGYEMVQALMGLLVFTTLPLLSRTNDQIALGLIEHWFSGQADRWRRATVHLLSAGVLGFLAWRLGVHAQKLASTQDVTPVLQLPLAPMAWFMTAAAAVSAVLVLLHAFRCFSPARRS